MLGAIVKLSDYAPVTKPTSAPDDMYLSSAKAVMTAVI